MRTSSARRLSHRSRPPNRPSTTDSRVELDLGRGFEPAHLLTVTSLLLVAFLGLCHGAAAAAAAQDSRTAAGQNGSPTPRGSDDPPPTSRDSLWWGDVDQIEGLLRRGKWHKAGRKAGELVTMVVDKSYYDPELASVLAELALQQAIADVAQGLDRRGLWRWHMALNLEPSLAERDLGPFGDAGKVLRRHLLRPRGQLPPGVDALTPPYPSRLIFQRPQLPENVNLDEKWVKQAMKAGDWRRVHKVELVVDSFGFPSHPIVEDRSTAHPSLIYGVLETLLATSPMTPGRLEGRATKTLVEVDINLLYQRQQKSGRW